MSQTRDSLIDEFKKVREHPAFIKYKNCPIQELLKDYAVGEEFTELFDYRLGLSFISESEKLELSQFINKLKAKGSSYSSRENILIGRGYYHGLGGLKKDEEKALSSYQEACQEGLIDGLYWIASFYIETLEGASEEDREKYLKLIPELLEQAAAGGSIVAWNTLGHWFSFGNGPKDFPRAVECFQKAIQAGYIIALNNLGVLYLNHHEEVRSTAEKGVLYLQLAIEEGLLVLLLLWVCVFILGMKLLKMKKRGLNILKKLLIIIFLLDFLV